MAKIDLLSYTMPFMDILEDNLPNRLTIFRICLVPIIIVSLSLHFIPIFNYLAAFIFVAASITDFLDGHIARKRKQITTFGSFLDPIADKFLVITSLVMLNFLHRINIYILLFLILREFFITSLRLLASERNLTIKVNIIGKLKTTFQMCAIPCLMINETILKIPLAIIGTILIYLAAILSLYSAIQYTYKLYHQLLKAFREKK